MKAYQIMMFLLIFNFMISAIGSLGIYALGFETFSVGQSTVVTLLGGFAGALMASALIGYFTPSQQPSTAHWVYELLGFTFFATFTSTMIVLTSISKSLPSYVTFGIFALFAVLSTYAFIAGLGQMVTGGWKAYK